MERHLKSPRQDWEKKLEDLGFGFHSTEGKYWEESAYYSFQLSEIQKIESATAELWELYLEAVQYVLDKKLFHLFHIPEWFIPAIIQSWEEDGPSVYGRFDLAYDGQDIILLEFNADTPTSLYEAAVVQWYWLQDCFPDKDQYNSLHEKLIAHWQFLRPYLSCDYVHFSSLTELEDITTVEYLRDTATQAGLDTEYITIQDIGWANDIQEFMDTKNEVIQILFKLYPYEWLIEDDFGKYIPQISHKTQLIEPAWKILASSKAMLPILWQLFPKHPLLLPAYHNPSELLHYVKKPIFSREGANISIFQKHQEILKTEGNYGKEGYIYQDYFSIPSFQGKYPVIGSWLIGQEPAGLGIRESHHLITDNTSCFVPHLII